MLLKLAIVMAVLSLSFAMGAPSAHARSFALRFHENPKASTSIERQKKVTQSSSDNDDADHGPSDFLSADLLSMTVIAQDVDKPRPKPKPVRTTAVVGFDNLYAAPVQAPAADFTLLRPSRGFGPSRYPMMRGGGGRRSSQPLPAAVPVPPALPLMATALCGLILLRRRRAI